MQDQMAELLYEGALALQQGQTERARELLLRLVEMDENNEDAWLWLSGAVDDVEDQRTALENVLALNPQNQYALYGLDVLEGRAQ
ncbi:hypothetical protein [Candidatus Viridilinea mediisalina]|uniref:Tetratricopeptide repeat protein n=1 Tax=Candidatus Viridilinea mediisalina TaxID=2024553 RepID=A0A2A6RFU5_9CHLR|nr:hypothetical protein [Candidatus Viridilinea mediisalina]PDW01892.1 hypothetical protein CJ255_16840 [Candidatus Viridilinea mediisalina]